MFGARGLAGVGGMGGVGSRASAGGGLWGWKADGGSCACLVRRPGHSAGSRAQQGCLSLTDT